jgi:hypothetical protein
MAPDPLSFAEYTPQDRLSPRKLSADSVHNSKHSLREQCFRTAGIKCASQHRLPAERFICAIQLLKVENMQLEISVQHGDNISGGRAFFLPHSGLVRTAWKVNARECT